MAWDLWLGILGFESLARILRLGILGSQAWDRWLEALDLGILAGSLALDLWLGMFVLGSWGRGTGIPRLGEPAGLITSGSALGN